MNYLREGQKMINTKEINEEKFRKEIKSRVHMTAKELKEIEKENNIKYLGLLEYLRRRNYKKIQKAIPKLLF